MLQGRSTEELTRDLGGIGLIWIETENFKLGSSLGTYKFKGDRQEKQLLGEELKRLKQRLPGLKPPSRELDPWLRAHLYAQRLEELYADFLRLCGFAGGDFPPAGAKPVPGSLYMGKGPYLGQAEKFVVLLAAKRSTLGRFTQMAFQESGDLVFRRWIEGGGMFVGCSAESIKAHTEGLDVAVWCYAANSLVHSFLEGLRDSNYCAPLWLTEGMGHYFSRRIDARWVVAGGDSENSQRLESHYVWAPRVRALVENRACCTWEEMMSRVALEEIPSHEHMVLWSRTDFLMSRGPAGVRAFLLALTEGGNPVFQETSAQESARLLLERQIGANAGALGLDAAGLEREWTRWVLKAYPKK